MDVELADFEDRTLQGMNFVAASLLLVMKNEEDAFWMLAVLLENILLHDSYSENLYGCHVEQRVFKDLFRKKCPRFLLTRLTLVIVCYVPVFLLAGEYVMDIVLHA